MYTFSPTKTEPLGVLMAIPSGRGGTLATLRMMSRLAKAGKKHPEIRLKAASLTRHLRSKDWTAEAAAIHDFVKNSIRYTRDILGVETVHPAEWVLRNEVGDCDDKSILVAALLGSIGHPTRFVAVGFEPGKFDHVYPETLIGRKWVAVETTEPVALGWQPRGVKSRMVIHN